MSKKNLKDEEVARSKAGIKEAVVSKSVMRQVS